MITTTNGNLTIVGINTATPKLFWKGEQVPDITRIQIDWKTDDYRIKIRVGGTSPLYAELEQAGIIVKHTR